MTVSLDCYDRQAIAFAATTAGISCDLVRDVLVQTLSTRFGHVEQLPRPGPWLRLYCSGHPRLSPDIDLIACRTPYRPPLSNCMGKPSLGPLNATTCL